MSTVGCSGFRIRLYFSRTITRHLGQKVEGCWYYVDQSKTARVSDIINEVRKWLQLPAQNEYAITLDGLTVFPTSPSSILEKDDAVKLKVVKKLTEAGELIVENTATVPTENAENEEDESSPDGIKKKRRRKRKKPAVREIRTSLSQCIAAIREASKTGDGVTEKHPTKAKDGPVFKKPIGTANDLALLPSTAPKRKHIRFDEEGEEDTQEEIQASVPRGAQKSSSSDTYPVLTRKFCENEKQRNVSQVYSVSNRRAVNENGRSWANDDEGSSDSSDSDEDENGEDDMMEEGGLSSPPPLGDPWKEISQQFSRQNTFPNDKRSANGKQGREKASFDNRSQSTISVSDVAKLPAAKFPPKIGSVISFKMLELSDKLTPEISDRKVGRVVSVDAETSLVSFEMVKGNIGIEGEDSYTQKFPSVTWSSVIDPRYGN